MSHVIAQNTQKKSLFYSLTQSITIHLPLLLVSLRDRDVAGAFTCFLAFTLDLCIVSNKSDVTCIATNVTAEYVVGEFASSIGDGSAAGKVGVAGSQSLFVVELGVGGALGEQVADEIGMGSCGDECNGDGSSSEGLTTESLAAGDDTSTGGLGLGADLELGSARIGWLADCV